MCADVKQIVNVIKEDGLGLWRRANMFTHTHETFKWLDIKRETSMEISWKGRQTDRLLPFCIIMVDYRTVGYISVRLNVLILVFRSV